jgi:hypothetical protein
MSPTGFEPAIPARERLQTHALDRGQPESVTSLTLETSDKKCQISRATPPPTYTHAHKPTYTATQMHGQ